MYTTSVTVTQREQDDQRVFKTMVNVTHPQQADHGIIANLDTVAKRAQHTKSPNTTIDTTPY